MIKEVEGNLLTYPNIQVIGHQTNCFGIMGGGIAKQIRNMYPEVYDEYYAKCHQSDHWELLGTTQICKTHDGKIVANLFGQYGIGGNVETNYDALRNALLLLKLQVKNEFTSGDSINIGLPYKIGCGLAGGDWDGAVYPIIRELFEDDDTIILYIVKYDV